MYRNVLCLVLGLIIGIRLTDFWDYLRFTTNTNCQPAVGSLIAADSTLSTRPTDLPLDWEGTASQTESLARRLFNETRVLCFVLTWPANHRNKAAKVKATWGKRCNKLIFMSTAADAELGAVKLNVSEGREFLYEKMRKSLEYIYEHHLNDYDWFLKADDDTYVIMENLRWFLHPFHTEEAVYFGCKFKPFIAQGYMSGGAGYVLSRDAVRRYNLFAKNNTKFCRPHGVSEDKEIGRCLQNVGVVAGDSRDSKGRERFLPLSFRHLLPQMISYSWLDDFLYYAPVNRSDFSSDMPISIHYAKGFDFDTFEFFIYHLKVFGLGNAQAMPVQLPRRLTATEMKAQLQLWTNAVSDNKAVID